MSAAKERSILMVCTGNMCRSPMAEALLAKLVREDGTGLRIKAGSAGTMTRHGVPPTPETLAVMREIGIDLNGKLSRPLTASLAQGADLILAMEDHHKAFIGWRFPAARGKTFTLGEYARTSEEVPDPYGGDEDVYRACRRQIAALLGRVVDRMKAEAARGGEEK